VTRLVVVFDAHAQRVDENGKENSALKVLAINELLQFQSHAAQVTCNNVNAVKPSSEIVLIITVTPLAKLVATLHLARLAKNLKTDRNLVSVSVTAPTLTIFLDSITAVIVQHGFGLLSVTAKTMTRFRRERKLSLLAIR